MMQNIARYLTAFFKQARTRIKTRTDHKTLSRHIMELNQKTRALHIIQQSACCLEDVIQCRLSALVLQKDQSLDAWFDPVLCGPSIEKMVQKDFDGIDQNQWNYFKYTLPVDKDSKPLPMKDMLSLDFEDGACRSKIYLALDHRLSDYENDIIQLVHQSLVSALIRHEELSNLSHAAILDPLTGCYNRREFIHQLKKNMAGAVRHITDLSILMLDLDHFKRVNDQFGHPAGDRVLKETVFLIQKNMRKGDILARYGGEEFVAILPGTGKREAMALADRIRRKLSDHPIRYRDETIRITASIGVAELDHESADISQLIREADDMLYKAKLSGRNTVMPGIMKLFPMDFTTSDRVEQMI